jgi:hypothetical protein
MAMDSYAQDPTAHDSAEDTSPERSGARDSLLLMAELFVGDMEAEQVRIRNLSSGGLMAEYAGHVMTGTPVRISVRGVGMVSGRIAWATDGRVGIAFDREIDPAKARKPVAAPRGRPVASGGGWTPR